MFNSGVRGRRTKDVEGIINPQTKYVQSVYPQPSISSYSITGYDDTALDTNGGQTIVVTGTGFATGVSATLGGTQIGAVSFISPTQISFTSPAKSSGTYSLVVYNSTGGAAILVPGLTYSSFPTFTTAAGSIGSVYETKAISTSVVATSDSAVTYSLVSGSLPAGATLASNGTITGTAPVDSGSTTYTFSIKATDAELQDVTRTFTLTVNTDVVTWVTPSNNATITLDGSPYTQALTATDAAGYSVSYTANALPTGLSLTTGVISGTPTVSGTVSTLLTATAATTNRSSTNTITWTVSIGDVLIRYTTLGLSANSNSQTSSFATDNSNNNSLLTVYGDTRAQSFHPYQSGYYSQLFITKTDYVSLPATTVLLTFTGDFTFEAWIYPSDTSVTYWGIWDSRQSAQTATAMIINIVPLASPVTGQGRICYYNGSYNYGTGIVYWNQWSHIAVVRIGTTMTFYINGVAGGTATISGTQTGAATTNPIYIGSKDNGLAGYGTVGYISNLRIVNGTGVYTTAFTPQTTPLLPIANTVLLTAQSNRFIDISPVSSTLTSNGTIKVSPTTPFNTQYVVGTQYYSTYFNGTTDYITFPASGNWDFSSGSFTIEFWMNQVSITATDQVVAFHGWSGSGALNYGWYIRTIAATGVLSFYANGTAQSFSDLVITAGQWTHIAFVGTGGVLSAYKNGVKSATTLSYTSIVDRATATLVLGGWNNTTETIAERYFFGGSVSNFRIVKGTALYSATFTPSATPLTAVANTQLLTCQDSTFKDNSTNNLTTTTGTNSVRPLAVSPFTQPTGYTGTTVPTTYGSGYFNGSTGYLQVPYSGSYGTLSGDFTIEIWFYPTISNMSAGTLFTSRNFSTNQYVPYLVWMINSTVTVYMSSNGSSWDLINGSSGGTASINAWNHFALVRFGSAIKTYLNGVAQTAAATSSATLTNPSIPLNIGVSLNDTSPYFTGYLSDFRLVKGTALYTSNFVPGFISPLTNVTNTQLLTLQTNGSHNTSVFNDNSGFNNLITRNGDTNVGTFSPYGDNWSVYFGGSGNYLSASSGITSVMGTGFSGNIISIECWLYPTSFPSGNSYLTPFMGSYQAVAANGRYYFGIIGSAGSTGNLKFVYTTSTSAQDETIVTTSNCITLNQWNHVLVTIDATTNTSTTIKLFANGTLQNTFTGLNFTTQTAYYSAPNIGGNNYLNDYVGYISNLRIVKGAFIQTGNYTVPTSPLVVTSTTVFLGLNSARFIDSSPINTTLTPNGTGSPQVQKFSPFSTITVPKYYSTYFDGTSTTPITIATASSQLNLPGDFTVEFWFYDMGTSKTLQQFMWSTGGISCGINAYDGNSTRKLDWRVGGSAPIYGVTAITSSAWHHAAYVKSGSTFRIFLDGVLDYYNASYTTTFTSTTTYIGGANNADTNYSFLGYISNMRVVKGSVVYATASTTIGATIFTPPTSPLTAIANTALLINQSSTLIDNSTNTLTLTGTTTVKPLAVSPFTPTISSATTYSPSIFGGSMYFDGTGDYLSLPNYSVNWSTFGSYTFEFWVYHTSMTPTNQTYLSTGSTGYTNFYSYADGRVAVGIQGTNEIVASAGSIKGNQWQHVAYTYDGTTTKIWVNGVSLTSGTTGVYSNNSAALQVGTGLTTQPVFGYMTDVRLTRGATIYTSSFYPTSSPLSASTIIGTTTYNSVLLLNGTNSGVVDQTRSINLETLGAAKVVNGFSPYSGTYYSVLFNGTSDYITAAANAALQLTADFTIEAWIYATTLNSYDMIFGSENGAASDYVSIRSNNTLEIGIANASYPAWSYTFSVGQWYHIAVTRSANALKAFVNGTALTLSTGSATNSSQMFQSSVGISVGRYGNTSTPYYFPGYISNARIIKGTALYTANFTPSTTPLTAVANTSLLTCQSNKFVDNSSNALTITATSAPKVQTQNPFQVNTGLSYYFPGTGSDYLSSLNLILTAFGTGDYTMEAWVFRSDSGVQRGIIDTRGANTGGILFYITTNGLLNLFDGTTTYLSSTNAVGVGQWVHTAVSRSSGTTRLFINGNLENTLASDTRNATTGAAGPYIGRQYGSTTSDWLGYLTDVRITKGYARYTSAFTPPTTYLVFK